MSTFLTVLIAGILTDNIVLSKLLAVDTVNNKGTLLEVLKRCGVLAGLLLLSVAASYPVINFVLIPLKAEFLSAFVTVLIICGILFAAFMLTKKFLPAVYGFLNENRTVLSCSYIVLGVCLLCFSNDYVVGYLEALVYALASAIGLLLVSLIFFGIRDRLKTADIPEALSGLPLTLILASLLSMAFGGFAGI